MSISLALAALLAMSSSSSATVEEKAPSLAKTEEQLRVLPVTRTPESDSVLLRLSIPREGEVVRGNPTWVQFRIDGYALGAASSFPRADEVMRSKLGQTVHVIIDDMPYFPINEPAINPFSEQGYFYNTSYKFEVPFELKKGLHTIRMFATRSYGESLKGNKAFAASYFYVGEKTDEAPSILSSPYLTYNEPGDQIVLRSDKPVLLDFLVTNCELSQDGYKVRLSIDGKGTRTFTSWQPFYIYGLPKGKHKIRLQLLDVKGKVEKGSFNDVERTITIE
jgi:hypothetical protein